MPVTTERLALALAAARKQSDLTQERVARTLDIDTSTIRKWEQGRNYPPIWRIPQLEDLYQLPHGWIFRHAGLIDDEGGWPIEDLLATDPRLPDDVREYASGLYRRILEGYIA